MFAPDGLYYSVDDYYDDLKALDDYPMQNNFMPLEDIAENETLFNSFISQSSIRYQCFKKYPNNTYYGVRYYFRFFSV